MLGTTKKMLQLSIYSTIFSFGTVAWAIDLTPDLQLHGYMTAGLAKLSGNQGQTYPANSGGSGNSIIESDITSKYDSVAGLQLNYHLNDQVDMAFQTYLAAQDLSQHPKIKQYGFKIQSAYVDYNFNDEWTIRVGRFPFATYLYSDNQRVGEAYPWAHLPPVIYAKLGGLVADNGVAIIYKHIFNDDWMLRIQPSFGQENLSSYQLNKLTQLMMLLSNDRLTLHFGTAVSSINFDRPLVNNITRGLDGALMGLGYSASDINQYNKSFASLVPTRNVRASFSDVGFIYDDGHWFAVSEIGSLRVSGFANDYNSGYASVGHHFGKWLPYLVYEHYKDVNLDEIDQIPAPGNSILRTNVDVNQYTISVGTRYKIKNNVSLKLQADRVSGFQGNYTSGLFLPPPNATSASMLKSVYIYSVSLSTAF
jgi:hypothetical protein